MSASLLLLAVLVAVAYGVQTAAGFGAGLVVVTIGANFIELPRLLALLLPLSVVQTGWIVLRDRQSVDLRTLYARVVPFMGVGVGGGYLLAGMVTGEPVVKQLLGLFVMVLAARELWRLSARRTEAAVGSSAASTAALVGAGVVHGIYATGGPLLVYALGREGLDRVRFRATISAVWLIMNVVLVTTFALEGRYSGSVLGQLGVLALALPLGMLAGERVFAGVDERTFKWGIYGLLGLAGIPLMLG